MDVQLQLTSTGTDLIPNVDIITRSDIPESLVGQALRWGADNRYLNPSNEGQGLLSRTVGKYFFRPIVRLIYALAVTIILPGVDLAYQFLSLLFYRCPKALYYRAKGDDKKDIDQCNRGMMQIRATACDVFTIVGWGLPSLVASLVFATGGTRAAGVANAYLTADMEALAGDGRNRRVVKQENLLRQNLAMAHTTLA